MDFLVGSSRSLNLGAIAEYASKVASQVEKRIDRALDITEADNAAAAAAAARTASTEGGSGFLDNILKPMVSLTTPVAESSAEPVVPTAISTEAVAPASAPVTPTRASRSRGARGRGALGSRALNGAASPAQSGAASPSLVDSPKAWPTEAQSVLQEKAPSLDLLSLDLPSVASTPEAAAAPLVGYDVPPTPAHLALFTSPPTVFFDESPSKPLDDSIGIAPFAEQLSLLDESADLSQPISTAPLFPEIDEPAKTEQEDAAVELSVPEPQSAPERTSAEPIANVSLPETQSEPTKEATNDERMAQRERQIMTLTTENASLERTIEELRASLSQLTETHDAEMEAAEEANARLAELEQEHNTLVQKHNRLRAEAAQLKKGSSLSLGEKDRLLQEKEEQVAQLMMEGEKLAKEQLKSSTTIKKLKAQDKEHETKIAQLNAQNDEHTRKIAALTEELKLAERQKDAGIRAQQQSTTAAAKVSELEHQVHELKAKEASLHASLQEAWDAAAEARKAVTDSATVVQTEALETALGTIKELEERMSTQARAGQETEAALRKELLELRSVLARSDDQAAWRQDQLSQEVRSLQERLQHAEARTTELAAATEEATRPLLRQIDSLQAQVMSSARSSQMIEESLAGQLRAANEEKVAAVEREKSLSARNKELGARLSSTEAQLNTERQDKRHIQSDLDAARAQIVRLESAISAEEAKQDALRIAATQALEEAREAFQKQLARQLDDERQMAERRLDAEQVLTRDLQREVEAMRASRTPVAMSPIDGAPPTPMLVSPAMSVHELLTDTADLPSSQYNQQAMALQRINDALRRKTAEAEALSGEVTSLVAVRDALAEEADRLRQRADQCTQVESALAEVSERLTASLELLQERTEELEALKSDMEDVKSMFRQQVTEMLDKIRVLSEPQAPVQSLPVNDAEEQST